MAILRIPRVCSETGLGRSKLYANIKEGLMTKPVPISGKLVGIPSDEVEAINRARVAGKTDDDIKKLVAALHQRRTAEVAA